MACIGVYYSPFEVIEIKHADSHTDIILLIYIVVYITQRPEKLNPYTA